VPWGEQLPPRIPGLESTTHPQKVIPGSPAIEAHQHGRNQGSAPRASHDDIDISIVKIAFLAKLAMRTACSLPRRSPRAACSRSPGTLVVNSKQPPQPEDVYIHRSGRPGREGGKGLGGRCATRAIFALIASRDDPGSRSAPSPRRPSQNFGRYDIPRPTAPASRPRRCACRRSARTRAGHLGPSRDAAHRATTAACTEMNQTSARIEESPLTFCRGRQHGRQRGWPGGLTQGTQSTGHRSSTWP